MTDSLDLPVSQRLIDCGEDAEQGRDMGHFEEGLDALVDSGEPNLAPILLG